MTEIDNIFRSFCDSILIIDSTEKSVKSSAGHNLMVNHPYAAQRFERAGRHVGTMLEALKHGDMETFGALTEAEALDLHAMIEAIERVRKFRSDTGTPVYFTLDAGPNMHLLYPGTHKDEVISWIDNDLSSLCMQGRVLHDSVGSGPLRVA